MKESGRIRILVFTAVLAAGSFVTLWLTRPAADNEMIEIAKSRQLQPLMEIDKPARLSKTVEDENRQTVEELYPFISQKIIQDTAVSESILAKAGTILDNRMNDFTTKTLPAQLKPFEDNIKAEVAAALDKQQASTDQQLAALRAEMQKKIDDELPKAVDAMIPSLVTAMVKEFTDKQEYYLPQLAEMLKPYQSLDEKQVKALYATYRNAVIADLVPPILDQVEADLRKRLAGDLASLPAKEAAVSAPEPTPTEVKATATPLTKAVTAPEITESETPTSLSTEDYMSQREKIRQQAIKQVLDTIQTGN